MTHELFFDGACQPNPGKGGAGAVLYENGKEIWSSSAYIGENETNNTTEYKGLILGLTEVAKRKLTSVHVKGDSQLVLYQLTGKYKVKHPGLKPLYRQAKAIENSGIQIEYSHVPRKENQRADDLSKIALEQN